jgi:hypothetical protein
MTDETDKTEQAAPEKKQRSALADKQRMNPVQRYKTGDRKTPMAAIAAFCYGCQGGSSEGDAERIVQAAVRDCEATECTLWAHRGWLSMHSYGGPKMKNTTP